MTAVTRLDDLCEAVVDCPHSTPVWTDHGALVLRSQNIRGGSLDLGTKSFTDEVHYRDRSRRAEVRAGDIVITREAPMGEVCMIPQGLRCCLGQRMVLLRPDVLKCDGRYLLYALQSQTVRQQISWSEGTGSTVSNLRIPNLKALLVPTPSIQHQAEIGDVLGALDDKIEQNRRTAQALERLARAIFNAWFVDFEPVKAKAAGATEFPSMPQSVFDALPTRFVDSEIGPVPDGWNVAAVSECAQLTMGQSPPSEHYNAAGVGLPFHQGVTDYGFRFPTHRIFCSVAGRIAEPLDVLLSVRAPVGRINVADRRLVLGRGLAGLRHLRGRQSFLLHQLAQVFAEEDAVGDGTIYKAVTKQFLSAMPLLSPPDDMQAAFELIARPLDEFILSSEMESRKLTAVRDYLLPKLMSGEVQVHSIAVEEANRP